MFRELQLSLSVGIVIIALSVGYYFAFSLPQSRAETIRVQEEKNRAEMEAKNQEQQVIALRMESRAKCIKQADSDKFNLWNDTCHDIGKQDHCFMPTSQAEYIQKLAQQAKDNCIKLTSE